MGTITIEIEAKDALILHNQSLEAALAKRNETIERLQAKLDAGEGSPLVAEAYEKGRKAGWTECANKLQEATRETARLLGAVNHNAFQAYLEGDRIGSSRQA
jgi:flagellar biosynthesis/type III secretory pathway protein FliH